MEDVQKMLWDQAWEVLQWAENHRKLEEIHHRWKNKGDPTDPCSARPR